MTCKLTQPNTLPFPPDVILNDYRIAFKSRQASLIGRREVMSGKAKFGIFGDGKEVVQVAMAHAFKKGDFRSGYYRDQTWMFALFGEDMIRQFFAQLYAHADVEAEPATGGRAMDAHFATRSLNPDGSWKDLTSQYNSSSDISPTGSQMPRLVGLGYASRLYRELEELKSLNQFSDNGNEVAFGTIGNASAAEGVFWEAVNAIGVLHVPVIITIYDDWYGISVPNEQQLVKENLSLLLKGFQRDTDCPEGFDLYSVRGWNYPEMVEIYRQATETARKEHTPALIHVTELTQPQGHSTSGSQERYKPKERLEWEMECDALVVFRNWLLDNELASETELIAWEKEGQQQVERLRQHAWQAFMQPILQERREVAGIIDQMAGKSSHATDLIQVKSRLLNLPMPLRRDIMTAIREVLLVVRQEDPSLRQSLLTWRQRLDTCQRERYSSHLHSSANDSALKVPEVKPLYSPNSPQVMGFELLNACFDAILKREPRFIAFGEDVGRLGDVNQAFHGLQEKYGPLRVSDTGIREETILGQAIGLALRGLRPIAEIQYLDYVLYALQIMSDDLATLRWRTAGGQKAPVIVRTRGHRLEGIWHSGSPMAGIINLVRGMYVLVPRNMTQAAGFYNTLLLAEEPALVVEVLNGYRLKETQPDNLSEITTPLGVPAILRPGEDVTLVTYGACCRIVMESADLLSRTGIQTEVIDVQSLLPFDLPGIIATSLQKTNRIVFVDEDVPGGTSAYMLQQVIEKQGGYSWLDSPPITIASKPHRPAYGSDGDYWSKPNVEMVFEIVYGMMHEVDPKRYPVIS